MMRAPLAQLERLVREAAGRSTLSVIRTDLARDDAIEWVLEHLLHVDVDSASPDDRKLLAFIERKRRIAAATVDDAPGAPTAYGLVRHLGHELPPKTYRQFSQFAKPLHGIGFVFDLTDSTVRLSCRDLDCTSCKTLL
jgi:predicted TIM-barrel fold metal-dependent hydrolase